MEQLCVGLNWRTDAVLPGEGSQNPKDSISQAKKVKITLLTFLDLSILHKNQAE